MTAKIIDFALKRRERQQNKEAEELLNVDLASLNEEQLKDFIMRLAAFAGEIEEVDRELQSMRDDQT